MSSQTKCLLAHTTELLKSRPRTLTVEQIVKDCPNLTEAWLKGVVAGRWEEPSVVKVQTLYEYLSGKKLLKIESE